MSYSNTTKIDSVMKFNGHEIEVNGDFGSLSLKKTSDKTGEASETIFKAHKI